ncbi:MAG: insulinase family protein [Tannerella sp.]|jgi:zinc protease|nr:insulinase family protein [Tannerella sp.]
MKHLFLLITLSATLALPALMTAQENAAKPQDAAAMTEKIVMDPKLRYGKLDNGLTFYIRHNELPKDRAEFYIVQNVGSMQEDDNQRGLAHFLEHMAFNGSKHFPSKNGIKEYTENKGMVFGENLNAYTSFEETVYMLMNAPVDEPGVTDSCLLILHDWTQFLLLRDEDIVKERGIIHEEWRTGASAKMRLLETQLPKMYPGSKYGNRLPIGDINIVDNFKGEELRDYYRKWYRPDLQGIIIVGDVDVDAVEKKIRTLFADVKPQTNPAVREKYEVADNERPLVSVATDKEMTNINLSIFYKHDVIPEALRGTLVDFISGYNRMVISMIMSERFSEILQQADPPFVAAMSMDDSYYVATTKDAWTSIVIAKPGELPGAMNALIAETERLKQFGFTAAEYERARTNILKSYESTYNERDKHQNSSYAEEYVRNFTTGECIPGIEVEYEIIKQIAPNFPVEGVNHFVKQLFADSDNGRNIVISLSAPEKEGVTYPAEDELLQMFVEASGVSVTANEEEVISDILIPELPVPGKIIEEKTDTLFGGVTIYTLSNGVRVVVKPTELKQDEIKMTATSPGGTTLFTDEKDVYNLKVMNDASSIGGLGNFSVTALNKTLAGKNVTLSAGVGKSDESINGSSSPSDLKTLFELVYLQMTAVRTDDEAYKSFTGRIKTQLDNQNLNPMYSFIDTLTQILYDSNPRNRRLRSSDFDNVDYHRMIDMYNERYADASDFVFTFIGNINKDTIRPLIEQYLATLPSLNRKEKGDPSQVTPFASGKIECHFTRRLETPKSSIALFYSGEMPYTMKNLLTSQLLSNILDLVYTEKVREGESASYGVRTSILLHDFPEGRMTIQIFYDTNPARRDQILKIVKNELERIAAGELREDYFTKSRLSILKGRREIMQENDYWLNVIDKYYSQGFDSHTEYNAILNSITSDDVKTFTRQFLEQGNVIEILMSPEE